ncbi:MAG: flagellar hook capping FlgD N-terminal domain-containing protein [Alphaproteobacteria bacterium]|jgi:flagellar basal-body rod modification protein FlgD
MSTIDPTSQAQLDSILKKIGVNNEGDTKKASKDTLGQSDFLKLMTTQLQNQDPFAPMENAEFIAQMAQFSTVTGITDMNTTLASMADQLGEFRIATAANLLGSSVMIPGNYARPDETGEIHGMLDLPSASGITNLTFSNAAGDVLHQMQLGAQPAGLVGFSWTDLPDSVMASGEAVRIEAFADMGKGMESLTPSVFAEILAASTGDAATGVMLDVRDYGEVRAADVSKFRR